MSRHESGAGEGAAIAFAFLGIFLLLFGLILWAIVSFVAAIVLTYIVWDIKRQEMRDNFDEVLMELGSGPSVDTSFATLFPNVKVRQDGEDADPFGVFFPSHPSDSGDLPDNVPE